VRASLGTTMFGVSQRVVPIGQHVLPLVPESVSRSVLAIALGRCPSLWGMFEDSKRVRATRCAYHLAFPREDPDSFTAQWIASRGYGLAASMTYMARKNAGRKSDLIHNNSTIQLAKDGPVIVALLHYSIDPVLPLEVLAANPGRDFRWPLYPLQPGIEDDRSVWLTRGKIPSSIKRTLLPITKSTWLIDVVSHIECGGDVFLAMDAPFDRKRDSATLLRVGQIAMPLASSIEFLVQRSGAQLLFAWPQARSKNAWTLHVDAVADTRELARAATHWIENNRCHWAGWPYLRWRETSVAMRRNVSRLSRPISSSPAPVDSLVLPGAGEPNR
jgi:hypothetical protein